MGNHAALAIVNDVRRVSALRRRPDRLPQPPDASTSGRSRSSASGHRVSNVGLTEVALFQGGFTGCAGVAPVAPFVALPSSFCRRSAGERGAEQVGEGAPMAGLGVGVIDRIVQHRKSVEGTIGLDRVIETIIRSGASLAAIALVRLPAIAISRARSLASVNTVSSRKGSYRPCR